MLLLPALLTTGAALAEDEDEADETPSLELLEFLADWETEDGQWIDPRHLGLEPTAPSPSGRNEERRGGEIDDDH